MKKRVYHIFKILFLMTLCAQLSYGQTVKKIFPKNIGKDMVLTDGDYIVRGVNTISENSILTVSTGVNLWFGSGAVINCEGGVDFKGAANKFITITSENPENQGVGFVFKGAVEKPVSFEYTIFTQLIKPIQFNKNWYRPTIVFKNNLFTLLLESGVFFEIQEIDKIMTNQTVTIVIDGNTISNNSGSMLLAEASWEMLKLQITNNVFSRNEFIGRELNGIFTTPLFLNYNNLNGALNPPVIKNNSISYNYGSLIHDDTIEFFSAYLTAIGSADQLDINQNYFGDDAGSAFERLLQQITSSQCAPFLNYTNLQPQPEKDLNAHIYKIAVNGDRVDNSNYDVTINNTTNYIEMISNKAVIPSNNFRVNYIYLAKNTLRVEDLKHNLYFENGNLKTKIEAKDRILKMFPDGYIRVGGLVDERGFIVPTVNIGLKNFLIANKDFIKGYESYKDIPRIEVSTERLEKDTITYVHQDPSNLQDSIVDFDTLLVKVKKKYWDVGIFAGSSLYFGDLVQTSIAFVPKNARPCVGIRLGYNVWERYRLEFTSNAMIIHGADIITQRGTGFIKRNLSFRTLVAEAGLVGEFRLLKMPRLWTLSPSLLGGVVGYYFNPQGRINNTWYDLRPLGTEGQRADGSLMSYGKYSFGIPLGIKLTKHLNQKTLISMSYTYTKLFHDYLDDISTGKYQSKADMIAWNPELGELAYHLANPLEQPTTNERSSSGDVDGYGYFGFTFTRKLYNWEKRSENFAARQLQN